ncbi:MAG: type III polyketide synthase [Planctomycetes bacterium]|nr:type III polyketide synthase [Planctomycetota bacterium]
MSFVIDTIATAVPEIAMTQSQLAQHAAAFANGVAKSNHAARLERIFTHAGVVKRHLIIAENVLEPAQVVSAVIAVGGESGADVEFSAHINPQISFYPARLNENDYGPTTHSRMQRYKTEALNLASCAVKRAFDESNVRPDDITQLITVSCTGFAAPGVDVGLIERFGLLPTVQRTNIGFMGCHGAINALHVANAFASAEPKSRILICCVELCSLHMQYGPETDKLIANALFSDGAAAVIGHGNDSARNQRSSWHVVASGSCLIPDSRDDMTWSIGDHGYEMKLSPRVPHLIGKHLGPWLVDWLDAQGLSIDDIGAWAVHPGGPKVLDAVADALDLPDKSLQHSRAVLAEYGNMSSATVLFILDSLCKSRVGTIKCANSSPISHPSPCIMLAFGPGLVVEAALLK